MSAIFILKKEPPKKYIFYFFKGRVFIIEDPIDMNAGVF